MAADSPTLLIRLRPGQIGAGPARARQDFGWGDYVAYSKICTHAGCPASLYEQQTSRLLCPCHQSQFELLEGRQAGLRAGHPAAAASCRSTVDDEGILRRAE